jgi:N-acetylmuramoyl-L-alanine amidase
VANNSYGYTLNGATIIIDAGHDKTSPGANGALMDPVTNKPAFPEYIMNANVGDRVAEILKGLGANVVTIDNSVYNTAVKRLAYFKAQNPHIMISIHHNSLYSYNSGATGRYFNAYSQQLCKYISESVRSNYVNNTTNVGAYDFDRLNMTREQYYPSMLLEVGFISNPNEQNELVKPENQQKIAEQIVKGMINYFKATGSLNHKVEESTPPETEEENTPTEEPMPPETTPDTSTETLAYIEKKTQVF